MNLAQKQYQREWQRLNKDKTRLYKARYKARHFEKWTQANREHSRKFRRTNPKRATELGRNARLKNPLLYQEMAMESYHRRRSDPVNAEKMRYYERMASHKRRALMRNATVNLEGIKAFVSFVKSKKFAFCYFCRKKMLSVSCHFDHIVPLSKGGQHSVENLCTSCPDCNHSKGSKSLQSWLKHSQQLLKI